MKIRALPLTVAVTLATVTAGLAVGISPAPQVSSPTRAAHATGQPHLVTRPAALDTAARAGGRRHAPANVLHVLPAVSTSSAHHTFLDPEHEEHHLNGRADMIAPRRAGDPWVHVDLTDPGQSGPRHRMTRAQIAAETGPALASSSATPTGSSHVPGLATHVPADCSGTDTANAGNRVQVVYAHEDGTADRYSSVVANIENVLADIDDVFAVSARQTGGGRRVRWVEDANCSPQVLDVTLPAGSLGADPSATFNALTAAGYNAGNRKYLVFADYTTMLYNGNAAGVGQYFFDSNPTGNINDGGNSLIARVDYWSVDVAGHELMHTLGAVQNTSPHHTDNGHCTDGIEMMCYSDGSTQTYSSTVCGSSNWADYDCNHDDYFSTNPAAGSYLATHWNTANSSFLASAPVLDPAPTVTLSSPASTLQSGTTLTLTATSPTATSYEWTANTNGCTATATDPTQATVALTCQAMGSTTVTITVKATAGDGQYTTATKTISVSNGPAPTATLTAPAKATAMASFTATVAGTGTGLSYKWTVQSDACQITGGQGTTTATITCPDSTANTWIYLSVLVTQPDGQSAWSNTASVLVSPASATATIAGPGTVQAGNAGRFTATVSNPGARGGFNWTSARGWISGPTYGDSVTVAPPATATGSDTLTATYSNGGATASVSYTLTAPLTLTVTAPQTTTAGHAVTVTAATNRPAAVSYATDTSACQISDHGDGTADLTCPDSFAGTVTVTVTAVDAVTGMTVSSTRAVTVTPPAGAAALTVTVPARATSGLPVTATGTTTGFPVTDPATSWTWSADRDCLVGNTSTASVTVQCTADVTGPVTVTATATSASGALIRQAAQQVTMSTPAAVATWTVATATLRAGQSVSTAVGVTTLDGRQLRTRVSVEQSTDAGRTWTTLLGTRTAPDGIVKVNATPTVTTWYRPVYEGLPLTAPVATVTVTRAPAALTVTARPGSPTRFTGTLRDTGEELASRPVSVQVKWAGSRSWAGLPSTTTDSQGRIAYTYKMATHAGTFRFTYAGDTTHAGVSRDVYVKVPATVTASVRVGHPDQITGIASTGSGLRLEGVRLVLQRRSTHGWVAVVTRVTDGHGRAVSAEQPRTKTVYRWVLAATATRAAATSGTVTVPR